MDLFEAIKEGLPSLEKYNKFLSILDKNKILSLSSKADVEDAVNKYLFNVVERMISENEKEIDSLDSNDPKVKVYLKKHIKLNETKIKLADVFSAVIIK